MNDLWAMRQLINGKKVRVADWEKEEYCFINKCGYLDATSQTAYDTSFGWTDNNWELYVAESN